MANFLIQNVWLQVQVSNLSLHIANSSDMVTFAFGPLEEGQIRVANFGQKMSHLLLVLGVSILKLTYKKLYFISLFFFQNVRI